MFNGILRRKGLAILSTLLSPQRVMSGILRRSKISGWIPGLKEIQAYRGLVIMMVGHIEDETLQALPRPGFWSLGKIGVIELMSVVGILAILVGIVAGTIAR